MNVSELLDLTHWITNEIVQKQFPRRHREKPYKPIRCKSGHR
jgi:hypothetical protein